MRASKPVSESKSILSSQMLPSDANPMGFVHGGTILKLVDEAAGVTALRHTRKTVVTASLDRMDFYNPVYVGNLLTLKASLNYAGHTSMEVGVRIEAEELKTGRVTHTGSSYLTYVAMDENGRPTEIPDVVPEKLEENRRVGKEGKSSREVFQVRVAVVGFGLMGRQIAQVFAQRGHEVKVTDESPVALKSGLDEVAHGPYGIESAIAKAKMTREEGAKTLQQIRPASDLKDACGDADLVIEAVYELLSLKREVFAKLESAAPPTALLASNTSTLTVSKIGKRLSRKDRLIGMHFFNPAQITKLVEIVKTGETAERTIQQAAKIVETIGKTPIIAHDEHGFIANRLGLTLYMEASALLEDGTAKIRDIDLSMKLGYNHPMGPFELADFVCLDTRLRNLEALFQATGDE